MNFGSSDREDVEAIERACDAFKAAWRNGQRPQVEIVLGGVTGPLRSALLRALLAAEIGLRGAEDKRPDPGEYVERFPADVAAIRTAFEGPRRAT
jgi:hypothetical protein